jgi:hypothetical protein
MTLMNFIGQNPALLAVYQERFSPTKQFEVLYRALGIDPTELERGPDEPVIPPEMLMASAGAPNVAGQMGPPTGVAPNPTGERGVQAP